MQRLLYPHSWRQNFSCQHPSVEHTMRADGSRSNSCYQSFNSAICNLTWRGCVRTYCTSGFPPDTVFFEKSDRTLRSRCSSQRHAKQRFGLYIIAVNTSDAKESRAGPVTSACRQSCKVTVQVGQRPASTAACDKVPHAKSWILRQAALPDTVLVT